ncbi:50S ribosomal protein L25/general stress protein Ctc [Aquibacillus sp. 3ASR75-11]|uniref:Large ribosomal subunit protein bL25 n=1 Tax=Terrihalobacillus insolitus TaxID=2950438 RepID=A0A9X3WXF2_9BACI|nr:50S ribosomal protein L25/general stress protein Ctc [Terrihalobacillus insolitus]MDC3414867.1 50S ribosomal protein L25/general stress protein Ctc [Terrihalobacillus insolitus]MDC3426016.1 50S ribosomal protein L25/general stress protein Ctc [Terrihalobacillus insolitus]
MAIELKANQRQDLKRSYTKLIRSAGKIPAIVYGKAKDPKAITVNSMELLKTVRDEGRNAIISLRVEGESNVDVMLHDYQIDPIKDELLHADFYVVNMSREMDVEVPIHLDGEAQGVKDGGVLQQPLHNLAVRAKPRDIPEEIKIDVSELAIGDSITVADLKESNKYEVVEEESTTIASVLAPDTGTEEASNEGEQEEPEVVGEDKAEEE